MIIKKVLRCIPHAIVKAVDHDGVEHAGYMSFMVLLSIFPFLVFFLALTSFFGASELGRHFVDVLLTNLPDTALESIKGRVDELVHTPPQSLMTLAIVGSIWTASSFVECLRTILNRVYEIALPPKYLTRRLMSILQFLFISILISAAMFLLTIVPMLLAKIPIFDEFIKQHHLSLGFLRYFLIFASLFLFVSSLYYIIPNIRLEFKEIMPGALLTVFLWILSGYLLSKYVIYYNQLSIVYGSLGSIIVTLIFFYIINMIFIYGAEFNYLLRSSEDTIEIN